LKKYGVVGSILLICLFLSACGGGAKDMTEYIDVDFTGMDTNGVATYSLDEKKLLKDTLNYDGEEAPGQKVLEEMDSIYSSYKIKLDKTDKLSNGDKVKVTVTVDSDKTKKIKSGDKTFEVTGLEEPKKLTSADVEKNLVLNFTGVSGKGTAKIDNIFDEPLSYVDIEIEDDGELKNGDKAKVILSKEAENELFDKGYVLDKKFSPEFEVKGLEVVAEKATDIANLDDIKRMIDEEAKRSYKDSYADESWGYRYEIKQEKLMYRQFVSSKDKNKDSWSWGNDGSSSNGNLIGIYTIKRYSGGTESKLDKTETAIIGYSNIVLDSENKANVADIEEIISTKDDTYSLESVLKLYEGYGYVEVK
jgi:hypothetical protein